MVPPAGLEPTTVAFEARYSIQLSYGGILVERTGFEPVISALKGRRPSPSSPTLHILVVTGGIEPPTPVLSGLCYYR